MKDFSLIILCAFRYALGKATYIPGTVSEFIKDHVDDIETGDLKTMVKEITEHYVINKLGHECDVEMWLRLHSFLTAELSEREVEYR